MRKKVTKIATSCSLKSNTMINKRAKKAVKPPRKTRSKTKKPKYLSLRLQLSSEKTQQHLPTQEISETEVPTSAVTTNNEHRQLNLFPLHPENDSTHEDHNMVNYFFSSADGGATTLTGLLDSSTTSTSDVENATATLSSSVSLNCTAYEDSEELLRTALRRRNEVSEERWVCYSKVVERRLDEEVTSCAVLDDETKPQKLDLKLDYEKIMNAWSDRGSLYIERDHTVPDINDDHLHLPHETLLNGLQDCPGSSMGLWNVPEIKNSEGQVSDEMKQAQRKASVLRYKEKRQNRLFAKRIRYEVRKLNAEKRPRVKGRFVKRS